MIKFVKDDILQSQAVALVNTVNTVGVMGKGIALQFREAFPSNYKAYLDACKNKELEPGKLLAVWDENIQTGKKYIINFPTKQHWRNASKYEYVEKGLVALRKLIQEEKIESIAIPPLGCGNGGLDWNIVKSMIVDAMQDLDALVYIHEPISNIKSILQKQKTTKTVKLTPARASLLYLLFVYESMGESSSLIVANKIAYFLQKRGAKLNLNFKPHHYGPYAIGVEKVLYYLNGVYLNGLEQGDAKPFEPLILNYHKWEEIKKYVDNDLSHGERQRLDELVKFLAGYASSFSMELLASVDYILTKNPEYSVDEVIESVAKWNPRKEKLFKREYVQLAYDHIKKYS